MMMTTPHKRKNESQTDISSKNPRRNHQEEEEKGEEITGNQLNNSIPYFPTHILFEILSRLRIHSLFNCRLVCKSWAKFISTSEFAQFHLLRSPTTCLIKPRDQLCKPESLHLFDIDCPFSLANKLVFVPKINLPDVPVALINSCNGLVCLFQLKSSCNIYVCNPVLGEYITIPIPTHFTDFYFRDCGFGFSHKTNQYKVILSSRTERSVSNRTYIYTLGDSSWRRIKNASYPIVTNNISFNAYLNGALHWVPYGLRYPFICCFDFVSEKFGGVPEPSELSSLKNQNSIGMQVGGLNGKLSICGFDYTCGTLIMIWVMKVYGLKESWSKDFVIGHIIHDTYIESYKPIMITSNGEILMIFNDEYIMLYDPKTRTLDYELRMYDSNSQFHAIAHVPSLISVKDVAKGQNLKVLGNN